MAEDFYDTVIKIKLNQRMTNYIKLNKNGNYVEK